MAMAAINMVSAGGVFGSKHSFKKMSTGGRLCTLQENTHFWVPTIKVRPHDGIYIRRFGEKSWTQRLLQSDIISRRFISASAIWPPSYSYTDIVCLELFLYCCILTHDIVLQLTRRAAMPFCSRWAPQIKVPCQYISLWKINYLILASLTGTKNRNLFACFWRVFGHLRESPNCFKPSSTYMLLDLTRKTSHSTLPKWSIRHIQTRALLMRPYESGYRLSLIIRQESLCFFFVLTSEHYH
jgi:hypothetical protein